MNITRRIFITNAAIASATIAAPALLRAADKITLTISHGAPQFVPMLNDLASQFTAKNPAIEVKFAMEADNWDPLLNSTFRQAVVGALPDGTWQSLTYARILSSRGIAQPLDPLVKTADGLNSMGISHSLIDTLLVNGQLYCMPFGTTLPVMYYNMDLLKRAGYSKSELPATWEEIYDIGKKVAALGGNINGGFIEYDATNEWIFQNLLASLGGSMTSADQKALAFDGPEGLQAMEILSRFGDINNIDMTRDQARQAFNAGVTGIHVRSASGISAVSKAVKAQFDFQIGQFPVPNANGRLVGAGHGFFMFTKDPERQKAVWELLKFISGPDGQMILAKQTGYMPINMLILQDAEFLDEYFAVNPYHREIVKRLPITGDQFSFPTDNTVKIANMMSEEMRKVVTHEVKPDEALKRMAQQTRELL